MRKSTENISQSENLSVIPAKKQRSSVNAKPDAKKSAPKKATKKQDEASESKLPKQEKKTSSQKDINVVIPKPTAKKKTSEKKTETVADISSKTPHVMRLVQPTEVINPVIVAGKSSIPKALRGVEPLSRMLRREAKQLDSALTGELVTVNLTAVAIDENAAEILRRFNACDCAVCVEELSARTAEQVTARFVKLKPQDAEYGSAKLDELKQPVKKQVMQQMIRIVIGNPKRSFHG